MQSLMDTETLNVFSILGLLTTQHFCLNVFNWYWVCKPRWLWNSHS